MSENMCEYAMVEINVTTACGIVPVEDAEITVFYKTVPGNETIAYKTQKTDKSGKTEIVRLPVKRVVLGDKKVDFPRRAECDIEVVANGYVRFCTRGVHLFPGVVVVCSFDLMPKSGCNA